MQLALVGKHDIDRAVLDQIEEFRAIAIDAECIRERERHLPARAVRDLGRLAERLLGMRRIPKIALEIDDGRRGNLFGLDIFRMQILRRAEISVHRALPVRRHDYKAASGRGPVVGRLGIVCDTRGPYVVLKHPAERIILDLAHERRACAETRRAHDGIRRRAPGNLHRLTHGAVDLLRARLVDQRHAAFVHTVAEEKVVLGAGDHIDNRVADAENVVAGACHEYLLSKCLPLSLRRAL